MDKSDGNKVLQYIKKHSLAYIIGIGINLGVDYLNLFKTIRILLKIISLLLYYIFLRKLQLFNAL